MKKWKRVVCVAMSMTFLMLGTTPSPSYAGTNLSSITNESIKEKQNQISSSKDKKTELQNSLSNAKKMKKELEALKNDVSAYITKIDGQLAEVEANIEEYQNLIIEKEAEIVQITIELEEALRVENEQYEAMKKRIKFMYERGDTFYLDIMLSANGFGDFLTKANYIESLSKYDRQKLDEYTKTREWTELVKATLEAEKEVLDAAEAALEAEKATLDELMEEKKAELSNYQSQINQKTEQIADYEADIAAETAAIEALEAAVLEEQKAIAAASGLILIYDGGKFTWPAPSYVAITDNFGYRTDPINGRTSYHSGIDMGAPGGSPILAAYDGVVVAAAYNYSMGNYVMINHGDGLYTVYMHASKLLVKADDVVFRGEEIAKVGTTGRSTGNHLHFSVRLNGSYVNPWDYLK